MPEADCVIIPDHWASVGLAFGHAIILTSVLIIAMQYDIHQQRKQPSLNSDELADMRLAQHVVSYGYVTRWILLAACTVLLGVRFTGLL